LCHVLAFPAVIAVLYFAAYIVGNEPGIQIQAFRIPGTLSLLNASGTLPLLGGFDLSVLNKLLALGALLACPTIPDIICKAVGKPSQAGGALEGGIMGNISSGRGYYNQYTGNVQKATGEFGSIKEKALGKRPSTGGWLGEYETKLALNAGKQTVGGAEGASSTYSWLQKFRGRFTNTPKPGSNNVPDAQVENYR
jgi:hypothetical protein